MWKFSKLARSLARSHIHRFFLMLVFCQYVVYSAIYHNKRKLHWYVCRCIWVLKIYVSEALARFARSRNISTYIFCRYISGSCPPPPPPHTKKLATLVDRSTKQRQVNWFLFLVNDFTQNMADFPFIHRPTYTFQTWRGGGAHHPSDRLRHTPYKFRFTVLLLLENLIC